MAADLSSGSGPLAAALANVPAPEENTETLRAIRAREREEAARELRERQAEEERASRLKELDLPPLYAGATLRLALYGSPMQKQRTSELGQFGRRYLDSWPTTLEAGREFPQLVVLRGDNGTGKTHWLYAVGLHLVGTLGTRARVVTLADLIAELRASWNDRTAPSETRVARYYRELPWLGIDEVTAESFMGEPTAHLVQLLSYREKWLHPTVITSNDDNATLARMCGAATIDRVVGAGDVIETGKESYRVHQKLQRRAAGARP